MAIQEAMAALKTETLPYGTLPSYDGDEPTKAANGQYAYKFAGWDPEIAAVTGDAAYTTAFRPVPAVKIIKQPTDQYVVKGQSASFSLEASGDDLTYQWYINRSDGKGWVAIEGATEPVYTTADTALDCEGFQYYCVVTDAYGFTAQTDIVTLHVVSVPQTGDSSSPMLWMTLSILGSLGILLLRKKTYSR